MDETGENPKDSETVEDVTGKQGATGASTADSDQQETRGLKQRPKRPSSSSTLDSQASNASTLSKRKSKKPYLNVAPLNTPLSHRLETVGVIWHCISIPFFICLFLFTISLGWVVWLSIILPYFIWWYGFDLHTPTNGKGTYRVRNAMKNLIVWQWFVNYFPIKAYKTVELEPTFSRVVVEDSSNSEDDDEQDLISETQLTTMDQLFKFLGLKKRLNTTDDRASNKALYKQECTGPRYIFGYHPHGVISMGVVGLFATNAMQNEPYKPPFNFLKPLFHDPSKKPPLFPGLGKIFPLTLTTQFTVPFYRDYLMSLGISSASARNIRSLITNGDNSVCLVVGGAQESLLNTMVAKNTRVGYGYKENDDDFEEEEKEEEEEEEEEKEKEQEKHKKGKGKGKGKSKGKGKGKGKEKNGRVSQDEIADSKSNTVSKREVRLVLNRRKGFVKLAIELGNVSLVPTFAFGEADIYNISFPEAGSLGYRFQKWMKNTFAFTVPFFSARGVFVYDFGLLPYRNPINIVMGKPIHVPAGALQEYRLKHPEEFEEEIKSDKQKDGKSLEPLKKPEIRKTNSFTDFLKLKKSSKPKPKAKVPQKLLDYYHKQYVDELKRVFDENKSQFGYDDVELNIIE
ncbi:uncharacterized protein LODBEIA_P21240 [Lodderomyces beijingensis]|uniref:diacylglycerol O-acyltransferase n=1 Tax=Lodderomyces beijingensis TaxID=1775926 RepID=A0ABP0ZIC1_9ASCO